MLKENLTKKRLIEGKVVFGTMVRMIRTPEVIPVLATAGWDYIVVDTEHCAFNSETLKDLSLVASYEPLTLLVRVPARLLSAPDFQIVEPWNTWNGPIARR